MSNEEKEEKIEITDVGVIKRLTELDRDLNNNNGCLLPFERLEIKIIADKECFKRSTIKKFNLDSSYKLMLNIIKNENIENEIDKDFTLFANGITDGIKAEYDKYNTMPRNLNPIQQQRERNAYHRSKLRVEKIEEERDNILKIIRELKKIYSENKNSINII